MSSKSKKNFAFLKPETELSHSEREAAQNRFIETGEGVKLLGDHDSKPAIPPKSVSGAKLYSSGKYKKVNIYLEPSRHMALKIEAARKGTDISSYIRHLLGEAGIE